MKHIHNFSLFILHFSFAFACLHANAAPSWLAIHTEAYAKDTSPSDDTTAYSAYYCTKEAAATMFGKSDVSGITAYFTQDLDSFNEGRDSLVDNDALLQTENRYVQTVAWDTESSQYVFTDQFLNVLSVDDYLAILLYQSGDNAAVRVLANADWWDDGVAFDSVDPSAAAGTIGAWTAAVPEPTSGVLLLLGLAGLALKRKRAPDWCN